MPLACTLGILVPSRSGGWHRYSAAGVNCARRGRGRSQAGPLGATCQALHPDPAAKEAAWTAALNGEQPRRITQAHARGIWVRGQEGILAPYWDRCDPLRMALLEQQAIPRQILAARSKGHGPG
jgi:hypothetical protein